MNNSTVLFVDDEENVVNSLKRVFHKEPYHVLTADSGTQGLEVMKENNVDVVVADYNMPKMNGIEFLKTVRKEWPDTARIMLTAHDLTDVAKEAINKGEVYRFITKPWDDNEIKQIIKEAFLACDLGINKKDKTNKKPLFTLQTIERLKKELIEEGYITGEKLQRAIEVRKSSDENLGSLLIKLNYITENKLIDFISKKLNIPKIDLSKCEIAPSILKLVPEKIARRYKLIPISIEGKTITIAMADPSDLISVSDIRSFLGKDIKPMISSETNIVQAINHYYLSKSFQEDIDSVLEDNKEDDFDGSFSVEPEEKNMEEMAQEPTVIALVNNAISQAVEKGASDIHINAEKDIMRVRFRIDGVLLETKPQSKDLYLPVVSRIKIMASMDISRKWIPQDGRIRIKIKGKDIELRVSTYPTINGESVVMRILDKSRGLVDISSLGFSTADLEMFKNIITKSSGIFLVTGPTGSGKTSTLYSAIKTLDAKRKNIITVEEPVEYEISNINQGEIREKRGFSFAHALRSILRHDPDIILVGEIRDLETAQIAFRAAMTGHFVFSTLHTKSAVGAVSRLVDLDVEPFLISSSLEAVLSQRLVRKICAKCKDEYIPYPDILKRFDGFIKQGSKFYKGRGCNECSGTGYKGRIGIFELFQVDNNITELIVKNPPEYELYQAALQSGMTPLKLDGLEKASKGLTTLEEIIRVI